MRVFKSASVGVILAVGIGVLAYALAPIFDAVGIYVTPGTMFLPLIPSKLVYRLDPNGGPGVGISLLLLSSVFFWTILFGAAHFIWVSWRRREP
jgi:hypothetical protein